MEYAVFCDSPFQISLREILEVQGQPVREEQAWAICHQLCVLLVPHPRNHNWGDGTTWKIPRIRGPESVLVRKDGTLSIKTEESCHGSDLQTEDQMVDFLGRLIYSALDWGLGNDVERELSDTLELLIYQMTKLDTHHMKKGEHFQPVCTFEEVLQICEVRLYNPAMAAHHYRAVCAILFADTMDLCQYIHKIQHAKETLRKLVYNPDHGVVAPLTANWVYTWKHVIDELRTGVSLRKSEEHQNTSSFLQVDLSPHEKLMNDIRYRQYTLRKVQTVDNLQRLSSPHDVVLNFVRSNPRLKPASDRRLKSLPKEEASLHQLLMTEIRSAGKLRPLASLRRRRAACQDVNTASPPNCVVSTSISTSKDSLADDPFYLLRPITKPDLKDFELEEDCKSFESSDLMHSAELPSSCTEAKFFPMLSSSPQDWQNGVSDQRRRSKSFDSSFGLNKKDFHDDCQPPTIADVMKLRQAECRPYSGYGSSRNRRMCSNCCKKSVHFTWHNTCAFCNRVVCPECCMEMLLPYKWCVHLPVSFFKKLVLMKDGDPIRQTQETGTFWQERWDWDCSRIPLVLESRKPCKTAPQHRSAMQDWYSNDICVGCQELLVEVCDSSFLFLGAAATKKTREL
ncbi:protein spire homolog 1-like [Acipenser ruthenus]|uniref:protein spire homolog 1-like n=1 Tax=Acipenser ruthenus TaxID=7906 RepID=UPI0027421C00|nr:protein spire homolog 1-like [Acipenser ruthenus]